MPSELNQEHCPTLPPGWSLHLRLDPDGDGEFGGKAELWDGSNLRCRMLLARYGTDRTAALARVHARVEEWVADWLARPHSGHTTFGEL